MIRAILFTVIIVAANASGYYYAPLGPWGVENTIVNMNALRIPKGDNIHEVKTTSRKSSSGSNKKVEEVKSDLGDDLALAEEAFFHAVESAEDAVVHAIDNEVENLFPHHKKSEEE